MLLSKYKTYIQNRNINLRIVSYLGYEFVFLEPLILGQNKEYEEAFKRALPFFMG
ncbi:TPA: hypothetical protein KPD61_002606 [Clostridioides difficile]|nr:hypothetical protein [Clostridioides difficile]HBG3424013.1 hypothetical protein [Clostridioides difficile]